MRAGFLALVLCLVVALVGACGGDDSDGRPTIRVSAAASLKDALENYAKSFDAAEVSYSFAGSDELAAQIKAGARPDVYAAANTMLPNQLHADGLVERPVLFATNRLVIAVPAGSGKVSSLADLAHPGLRIAVGSPTVPVGSYARKVLARLPPDEEQRTLANIRSNEPDVAGVIGKLSQGAADAGFVYITDVRASGDRLAAIGVPYRLRPVVAYAAAVVKSAANPDEGDAFVRGLTHGAGRKALFAAGFGAAPRPSGG
jgi:molybdate transport system substrate-binding protein